jgi:hypothetical protein
VCLFGEFSILCICGSNHLFHFNIYCTKCPPIQIGSLFVHCNVHFSFLFLHGHHICDDGSFVPFTLPLEDDGFVDGHVFVSHDLLSLRSNLRIGIMCVDKTCTMHMESCPKQS